MSWHIQVQTLSSKKVHLKGDLIIDGNIASNGGGLKLPGSATEPAKCTASLAGFMYFDNKVKKMRYCDGAFWQSLAGSCGNGVLNKGEECDDGNQADGDGCSSKCLVGDGKTKENPALNCKMLLAKNPKSNSGLYWVNPAANKAVAAFQTWCDMTSDGGGWTRFLRHSDPNGKTAISQSTWDSGITLAANGGIKQWMVKTWSQSSNSSEAGTPHVNSWVLNLAAKVQGANFMHFKHLVISACNKHRYEGASYVHSAKLLAGSQCKSLNHTSGRELWGEHKWCSGKGPGWMWFTHCGSPSNGHLLYVNYTHDGTQTKVLTSSGLDNNGAAYEFFYR